MGYPSPHRLPPRRASSTARVSVHCKPQQRNYTAVTPTGYEEARAASITCSDALLRLPIPGLFPDEVLGTDLLEEFTELLDLLLGTH